MCLILIVISGLPVTATDSPAVGVVDVDVSPEQPAPGEPTIYYVTIENNADQAYEVDRIEVEHESPFDDPEQVWDVAVVPPGGSIEVPISVTFDEKGLHKTQVVVYGSTEETSANRQYPAPVVVRDSGPDVMLSSSTPTTGSETDFTVRAINGEDRSIRNINLTVDGEDVEFNTTNQLSSGLNANEERDFTFRYVPESTGETELTAKFEYTTDSGHEQEITKSTNVDISEPRSQSNIDGQVDSPAIQLTGIDVVPEGEHMLITGSASNVGTDSIDSVLVRVVETENVKPTAPNRDFFVGTVPGSDFGTFDLTAEVSDDATQIPVELTYISGDDRITEQTVIEVPTTSESPNTSGDTYTIVYIIGGVLVVGVLYIIGIGVHNSRKDDGGY